MAKRRAYRRRSGGPNKAQAIRDQLSSTGIATPTKEVIARLSENGIVVSAAHVSNVKAQLRRGSGITARRGRPRANGAPASDGVSLSMLLEAKRLAERLGGVDQLRRAAEALVQLQ